MSDLSTKGLQTANSFSHRVLNRLTVVIGNCDLLREELLREQEPSLNGLRRVEVIRGVAAVLVGDITEHRSELDKAVDANFDAARVLTAAVAAAELAAREQHSAAVSGLSREMGALQADGKRNPEPTRRRRVVREHAS